MHFDLTSTSLEDQQATVERALSLGGRHIDVGQLPEEEHVVLADPEGNEFCVIEPGNDFLDDCGVIGALSSDGTQAGRLLLERGPRLAAGVGPGRGDRDPIAQGGPKITWGGPPLAPKTGKNRLHLDLAPSTESDQTARSTGSSPSGRGGQTSVRAT